MSIYKPGETSEAVKLKKTTINKSIIKKSELLDTINSIDDIYTTLSIKGYKISEAAVHKWSDDDLGIIAYSWNTARAVHNSEAIKQLQESIKNANKRLAGCEKETKLINDSSDNTTSRLRKENEYLKRALAEVYRAYMHLVENYREDKVIDEAIRQLIQEQARLLGKNRVWEIR